jgi:hypothetical protein
MSDVVESLRRIASRGRLDDMDVQELFDAADYIERLRVLLSVAVTEIETRRGSSYEG